MYKLFSSLISFYTICFVSVGFSVTAFASEEADQLSDLVEKHSASYDLALEGKYDEARRIIDDNPLRAIPLFEGEIVLFTLYYRLFTLGLCDIDSAKKERDNPLRAAEYFKKAIDNLEFYIETGGKYTSPDKKNQSSLILYRFNACRLLGCTYIDYTRLSNSNNMELDLVPLFKKAISAMNIAIGIASDNNFEDNSKKIAHLQHEIIGQYCSLALFSKDQESQNSFLSKARTISDSYKNKNYKLYSSSAIVIEDASQILKSRTQREINAKSRVGDKIKKIINEKITQEELDHVVKRRESDVLSFSFEDELYLEKQINLEFQTLKNLYLSNTEKGRKKFIEQLLAIEKMICNFLKITKEDNGQLSYEQLKSVYKRLSSLLDLDISDPKLSSYCSILILSNIDESINRLEVLRDLQIEKYNIPNISTRIYLARAKALRGENTEWIELEQGLADKKRQKQEARKKNKSEKCIAQIQAKQNTANKESAIRNNEINPPVVSKKGNNISNKAELDKPSYYDSTPYKSSAEEKLEKLERHDRAEQMRKEEETKKSTAKTISPDKDITINNKVDSEKIVDDSLKLSLQELYDLKGVAKKVDQEIEDGTWKITREQLQQYFEAMGCLYKPGNSGSHNKLALPKSTHVEHDGQIISIFIDAGGALTLPPWEKGYIKHYLKPQVLAAREKLRELVPR